MITNDRTNSGAKTATSEISIVTLVIATRTTHVMTLHHPDLYPRNSL